MTTDAENTELAVKKNPLQVEMDKIFIQLGKGTLDWIIKKEETGNRCRSRHHQRQAMKKGAGRGLFHLSC
jgi:hypothetical protein